VEQVNHPIADMFKNGILAKPAFDKKVFYVGGMLAMIKRLKAGLVPFAGAYEEYAARTEGASNWVTVERMWEYVRVE
jgi:hypothetical protein